MATYTLIPSSLTGGREISNASNSYTDTNSDTYAEVVVTNTYKANLGGFDRSVIPSGMALAVSEVRLKAKNLYATDVTAQVVSAPDGVALSNPVTISKSAGIITFTLTETPTIIAQYLDTLCIHFSSDVSGAEYLYIYGAEIIVTATLPSKNKVIFGNETLIDLTGDTATASDVASGKTFHLASGLQAIGAYVPSANKKTASSSSSTATSLAFTGLTEAPSFFVALPNSSIDTSFSGARAICFLYNGETTYKIQGSYSNGATRAKVMANSASFTYSSGTLTVKSSSSVYILQGGWNLFYM